MANVSRLRQGGQYGVSSGGGDDDLIKRVTVLEVKADNLQRTLDDVKTDVRELRNWGLGAVVTMLALGGSAFAALWLKASEVERVNGDLRNQASNVSSSLDRIERQIDGMQRTTPQPTTAAPSSTATP